MTKAGIYEMATRFGAVIDSIDPMFRGVALNFTASTGNQRYVRVNYSGDSESHTQQTEQAMRFIVKVNESN